MEILFNIFTQYSILVMNGCFDQNTGRKLHSLFSYHFQNIAAPFIIEACCGGFFNKNTNSSWPEFCEQTVCQCPDHMLPSSSQNIVRSCLFVHMVWMDSWPRTYVVVIRAERRKQTWEESSRTSKNKRRDSRHKKVGLVYYNTEKVVMNRSLTYLQRQTALQRILKTRYIFETL